MSAHLQLLFVDELVGRKRDFEHDVQVALLERVAINWHAFMRHGLDSARLDHLARRMSYDEIAAVEMFEREVEAAQCLRDSDRVVAVEVVALALEQLVFLLLQHDDDVTSLAVRLKSEATGTCIKETCLSETTGLEWKINSPLGHPLL